MRFFRSVVNPTRCSLTIVSSKGGWPVKPSQLLKNKGYRRCGTELGVSLLFA
jgi:hypothetical protein